MEGKFEKITVTSLTPTVIPDGTYEAEFISAITDKRKTVYGERMATTLKFRIVSGPFEGNTLIRTYYWPQPNGVPVVTTGSALGKAIKEITGKEELDETAVGNLVFIRVENKQVKDRIVTNITDIVRHPNANIRNKNINNPTIINNAPQQINNQQNNQIKSNQNKPINQSEPIDFSDLEL